MQLEHIVGALDITTVPRLEPSLQGILPRDHLRALVELLRTFTTTPSRARDPSLARGRALRSYFVFCGAIESATELEFNGWSQAPNLWWPDDRSWCVATEVDGYSTYVGGSAGCVEAIQDDQRLEALPSSTSFQFDLWSERVDPRPPGMRSVRASQSAQPFHRERRLRQRQNGKSEEHQGVVVAGCPVQVNLVATGAPVHDDPLAAAAHGDADRLHERAAVGLPVAGSVVVEMTAPQTVRTVVPMGGAGRVEGHVEPAMAATERARLSSSLIATLIA
jgi:hypothetical protein